MPYMVVFKQTGLDQAWYDRVRKAVDWEHDPPPGSLFHVIGFEDGVMHAVDIWNSLAERDAYYATRLGPALAAEGRDVGEPTTAAVHIMAMSNDLERHALTAETVA